MSAPAAGSRTKGGAGERASDTIETVGRYRLFEKIGSGGMGVVYRGFDPELHRAVALKCVRPDRAHSEDSDTESVDARALRRLKREARAVARLNHPAIAQVYDVLEQDGAPWIVLELVDGQSIPTIEKSREVSWQERLRWFRQISEGLAAAHKMGLLHRDLKHENVLVAADGSVKILDFGLALDLRSGPDSHSQHRRVAGTARVMSPEQVLGQELDARSDLFSLGVLIYETVAGLAPFQGDSNSATFHRVLTHHPSGLPEHDPSTPPELSRLVEALLNKDPEHRPASAEQVMASLETVSDGERLRGFLDQSTLPPTDESRAFEKRWSSSFAGKPDEAVPRWLGLVSLTLIVLLIGSVVAPQRGDVVMGSDSPDVVEPEALDVLFGLRVRLKSTRGLEQLQRLEGDIRGHEARWPELVELKLMRCTVLRRLFYSTQDASYLERALGVVAKARLLHPEAVDPVLTELILALSLGRRDRAAQLIDEIDQRAPGRLDRRSLRTWFQELDGQTQRSLEQRHRLAMQAGSPDMLYELALAQVRAGDYLSARRNLGRVLELDPTFTSALALLAQVEMLGGDLEVAAGLFRRLLVTRQDVRTLTNLGIVELLRGRMEQALPLLESAVELAPRHASYRLNLADGQAASGDLDGARANYALVLELQDRSPATKSSNDWTVRAQALAKLGRPVEALAALENARQLSESPQVGFDAALVYAELGEDQLALEHLYAAVCENGVSKAFLKLPALRRFSQTVSTCRLDKAVPERP